MAQHSIDTNYGTDGTFGPIANSLDIKDMIQNRDNGQFIISQIGSNFEFPFIAKINPDGALDTTFNEDGAIIQWFQDDRKIIGLAEPSNLSDDGFFTLYQGNDTTTLKDDLLIMKFTQEGYIDTTWSQNGLLQITPSASSVYEYEYHNITTHISGIGPAIVVTGIRKSPNTCDEIFLFGITEDGEEDLGFGIDGFFTLNINAIVDSTSAECTYNIIGVNERGGSLVASLESSDGVQSFCIARASATGDGSIDMIFQNDFVDSNLDYFTAGGIVFLNYPLLFTDESHKIVEQSSLVDWVIAFQEDNISLLTISFLNGSYAYRNLNLPEDATYRDISARIEDYGGEMSHIFLTGEKNDQVHIATVSLCEDENVTIQTSDIDFASDSFTGLYITNQNKIGQNSDSLIILYSDMAEASFSTVRILGNSSCLETDIADFIVEENEFRIYPNPVTDGSVTVEMFIDSRDKISISLHSLHGQNTYSLSEADFSSGKTNTRIELPENIVPGVYLLAVETESEVFSDKIIIQ